MKIKEKNVSKKSGKSTFSTVMYVFAAVVGVFGIALLVNNILLFKSTVSQAIGQGYDIATVKKALLTSQLIPGIIEPVATYGGIALILLGVGKVNKKVSNCLALLSKVEVSTDVIEEKIVEQNVADLENTQSIETNEAPETV